MEVPGIVEMAVGCWRRDRECPGSVDLVADCMEGTGWTSSTGEVVVACNTSAVDLVADLLPDRGLDRVNSFDFEMVPDSAGDNIVARIPR